MSLYNALLCSRVIVCLQCCDNQTRSHRRSRQNVLHSTAPYELEWRITVWDAAFDCQQCCGTIFQIISQSFWQSW